MQSPSGPILSHGPEIGTDVASGAASSSSAASGSTTRWKASQVCAALGGIVIGLLSMPFGLLGILAGLVCGVLFGQTIGKQIEKRSSVASQTQIQKISQKQSRKPVVPVAVTRFVCENCSNPVRKVPAEVYCPECSKSFCRFCVCLLHHPDTKNQQHSIEEIDKEMAHEVAVITPILLDLLLLLVFLFLINGPGITEDYFAGDNYCPAVSKGRRLLLRLDPNAFFHVKSILSSGCDHEDSYWRFFIDTWVRGMLTQTDGWFLLISEFFKAIIFEETVRRILTPFIAYSYSLVAFAVGEFEYWLYEIIHKAEGNHDHWVTKALPKIKEALENLSFVHKLEVGGKLPPPTLMRKRKMKDWVEFTKYVVGRHSRNISFYKAQAGQAFSFVLWGTLQAALVIRVLVIMIPQVGPALVSIIELLGIAELSADHRRWFTEYTGVDPSARGQTNYISEWILRLGASQAVKRLPIVRYFAGNVAQGAWDLMPLVRRLVLPVAIVYLPIRLGIHWKIKKQNEEFGKWWKEKAVPQEVDPNDQRFKEAIWPNMSRKRPLGVASWEEVRFSRRDKRENREIYGWNW